MLDEKTTQGKLVKIEDLDYFLNNYYGEKITDLKYLSKGKHSEAFLYILNEKEYVVRFNKNNRGFLKDKYAFENFSANGIIIPKIYEIGRYREGIYFCISEKISGEIVKDQYSRADFSSLSTQFQMIENIRGISMPNEHKGFGEWEPDNSLPYRSLSEYIQSLYNTKDFFDWDKLSKLAYFDKSFTDYLSEKINHFAQYTNNERVLMHGDFGNDNLFIEDAVITGIIDWERSRYADHFFDVGRVVLYCPSREATVTSALSFYARSKYKNYKERIALGVYFTMLNNYGLAALSENQDSCVNSPKRIKQFEELMGI